MVSTYKLLAVLQLPFVGVATLFPRQGKALPPLQRTNNNTWIISGATFIHPGPAMKRNPEDMGDIGFNLRRTVWEKNRNASTLTFVHVPENKAMRCEHAPLAEFVHKIRWRECSGYKLDQLEKVPPGDESILDELNNRLRFRHSDLVTSPEGYFQKLTLEIVNHVAPRQQVVAP
jgi:hypothetical protein